MTQSTMIYYNMIDTPARASPLGPCTTAFWASPASSETKRRMSNWLLCMPSELPSGFSIAMATLFPGMLATAVGRRGRASDLRPRPLVYHGYYDLHY